MKSFQHLRMDQQRVSISFPIRLFQQFDFAPHSASNTSTRRRAVTGSESAA